MIPNTPYIDLTTTPMPQYVPLYKSLLTWAPTLGLTLDAVYLYSHLCALAVCSTTAGFVDKHSRVYVIYTRERAAKLLGCSARKITNIFRSLARAGLIDIVTQVNRAGCNVAPHIYLHQWAEPSITISLQDILAGKLPILMSDTARVLVDTYYRVPYALQDESYGSLSVRAKVLYSIALDTMQLSLKYQRVDDNGFWCSLSAGPLQQLLQCGHASLSAAYKELELVGLMVRQRVECGCTMHTYLRACWELPQATEPDTPADSSSQSTEKSTCSYPIFTVQSSAICSVDSLSHLHSISQPESLNHTRALPRAVGHAQRSFFRYSASHQPLDVPILGP